MKNVAPLLIALLIFIPTAFSQTTEFTYQGRLINSGLPASVPHDFEFRLFSLETGGAPIGETQIRPGVPISNGVFTVRLNFGAEFDGAARWLEISVRQTGGPTFALLNPRQPLSSAPYSIKSLNSDTSNASTNAAQLGGIAAGQYVITTDARMSDARVPTAGSADYVQNRTTQQALSNFNVSGDGTVGGSLNGNVVNAASQFNIAGSRVFSVAGSGNVIAGLNAGPINTGFGNTFVGQNAGSQNTTGPFNAFIGVDAGLFNTTGDRNTFLGSVAGRSNTTGFRNVFVGTDSGFSNTTGNDNTFVGYEAGFSNTTTGQNTFVGRRAGRNTTVGGNSFFGWNSGLATTTGGNNAFFGVVSGQSNTTGGFNSFFGASAGASNTTGTFNAFFGTGAGGSNTTNGGSSFFGYGAGGNSIANGNTFVGFRTGEVNTTGSGNTLLGFRSEVGSNDLLYATAIGAESVVGTSNTIALGRPSGADTVQIPGTLNVVGAINGTVANATNAVNATTAQNALNLGGTAANQFVQTNDSRLSDARTPLPNSTNYIQNTTSQQASSNFNINGTGTASIFNVTTQFNIAGNRILSNSGSSNLFAGVDAGTVNTGFANSFFGFEAGRLNQSGRSNTFVGAGAGQSNVSGSFNSFFGGGAGLNNTGTENSFFGYVAGASTTSGSENAFFGRDAGNGNTSGSGSLFLGKNAGNANTTGNYNTVVGYDADTSTGNLTNAVAIGSRAFVSQSNSIVLGSISDVNGCVVGFPTLCESVRVGIGISAPSYRLHVLDALNAGVRVQTNAIGGTVASFGGNGAFQIDAPGLAGGRFQVSESGNVGIGTNAPNDRLEVNGVLRVNSLGSAGGVQLCRNLFNQIAACSSSLRYKNNIEAFPSGLSLINRLRPVTFNWKQGGMPDMGLVAEEVAEVEPLLVTYNDKSEVEGVKYDRIGVIAVNAIKEQQEQIERQQRLIEEQEKGNADLRKEVVEMREKLKMIQAQGQDLKKALCGLHPELAPCKEEK